MEAEIVPLLNEKQNEEARIGESVSGISVNVGKVMGETVIRTRTYSKDNPKLSELGSASGIRTASMDHGTEKERLFSGSAGKFDWNYKIGA